MEDEVYDDEEDEPYRVAHSPSELNVKCQDIDEADNYQEEHYYHEQYMAPRHTYQFHHRQDSRQREIAHLPPALIQDLQAMLADYRPRFPPQQVPTENPLPQVEVPVPVPEPTLLSMPAPAQGPPDTGHKDTSSSDEEVEEGELPNQANVPDPWDEYIVEPPSPPPRLPSDSPEDIGGFHNLMQRAAARFQLPITVKKTDCFLHDFKEDTRKLIRSIPIIDYIWQEGVNIMITPASITAVLPCIEKKYRAPENSPSCLIGHPRPDSVIS